MAVSKRRPVKKKAVAKKKSVKKKSVKKKAARETSVPPPAQRIVIEEISDAFPAFASRYGSYQPATDTERKKSGTSVAYERQRHPRHRQESDHGANIQE